VLNLLSNAVKYSDTERWIAVRVFRRAGQIAIQVEDHGIGIAAAEQRRIFEEFYRVDQRLSSAQQGLGLGLTLVRRIVDAHGGTVQVESTPGAGACFTVWLPTEVPPAGAVPAGVREEAAS
jgi:signal transduction histidine kinase